TPLESLERDVAENGIHAPTGAWQHLTKQLTEIRAPAGTCIYGQHTIGDRWLFISSGIVASQQSHTDGSASIARFFERGQIGANLTSTWTRDYAPDDLIALTDMSGVEIPDATFREVYLKGGWFGEYLRIKAMQTLCFDKEIIAVKTRADTDMRYSFLEQHSGVIGKVRQKDIAAFIGVTPQGLSRFLRNRNRES
ncbi:MAG: cyclic nucleotide-binding domain-containing protein, partial [Pseudomonadota bacterium]